MSDRGPRVFSTELKEEIVLRLEAGERISAVSAETGIRRKLLYQWRDAYRAMGVAGFNRKRGRKRGWKRTGSAALPALAAPADATSPSGGAPISTRSSKK